MNCEQSKARMADWLAGNAGSDAAFTAHLAECESCRRESEQMRRVWENMGSLPAAEPGPEVRWRFYQMLEAYEAGRKEASASRWSWWRHPVLQFGLAALLLIAGATAGRYWPAGRSSGNELEKLQAEVQNMRQLVALSLLQQQSASERLRGVTWSYRVESPDKEVQGALLKTISNDPSVDVRLAAVDALSKFSSSPSVRTGLADALPRQTSPLVQVALLDLIGEIRDRHAVTPVRNLLASETLDENVRSRAQLVMKELQ